MFVSYPLNNSLHTNGEKALRKYGGKFEWQTKWEMITMRYAKSANHVDQVVVSIIQVNDFGNRHMCDKHKDRNDAWGGGGEDWRRAANMAK